MSDRPLSAPPEETKRDLATRGVKGLAGAIPVSGGILAEAVDFFCASFRKRQEEWLLALWLAVRRLQEQSVLPADDSLVANEAFLSATAHAIRVASRTHHQGKREALRNAVLNVAAGTAPAEDQQSVFLDAIDSLTASHVLAMRKLTDLDRGRWTSRPGSYYRSDAIRPPEVEDGMFSQIVRDLRNRGFIAVDTALDQLDADRVGSTNTRLTDYGKAFLAFITSPLEEEEDGSV